MRLLLIFALTFCGLAACQTTPNDSAPARGTAVPVTLTSSQQGYQIYRDGAPFFIRGAGGHRHLDKLVVAGGNAIRTWSADNARQILDDAHARGLVVMLGLSLGHERHGFDYSDDAAVAAQFERVKATVLRFKDHPALLAWGIGNEVDLFYNDTSVWYAIEDIAAFIQRVDPNHLVTTVTAGMDKDKLDLILERVPSLDYLSINIYGGLETLPGDLLDYGYDGPFVVTEWGPTGHWQVARTRWDVPVEQTSTEKAASYRQRYQQGIVAAQGRALGSFAFLWGQKQETTPTWYGVFTENGNPTEVVDALTYNWTGQWPKWRAPSIDALTLENQGRSDNVTLPPQQEVTAMVEMLTRSDASPSVHWQILPESTDIKAGGDPESRPSSLGVTFKSAKSGTTGQAQFTTPASPGAYRLFITVKDKKGRVANANLPFFVTNGEL
ncbi:glycoside hydrolase family 2 TIM barrel-domain containing protein [Alteromonas halophila]|uniref:Glycoside hydrolase family 2 catalytic domain-containing protein n=1 Tax=Alteromonas halophila TaxID=516698 RepID=A0A918JBV3_9ALTE|nr:glycoside hydrolase family 2 TIM barrel-domain containing protein [Alteromonas halophila]GGW73072.1 hypothetical protein GCM10007391_00760 [Alteromonas halophila]